MINLKSQAYTTVSAKTVFFSINLLCLQIIDVRYDFKGDYNMKATGIIFLTEILMLKDRIKNG